MEREKNIEHFSNSKVDVNNLMRKVNDERKKSKRQNIVVSAAALSAVAVNFTTPDPSPLGLSESNPTISIDNVKFEGITLSGSLGSVASSVDSPEHEKIIKTNKNKLYKPCFNC